MAEASRRADRRGPSNALFLAAGVETLPASPLTGSADLVTVMFPWGSLLRGVLGLAWQEFAVGPMSMFLFQRAATIYGGAREVQKNIIAKIAFGF